MKQFHGQTIFTKRICSATSVEALLIDATKWDLLSFRMNWFIETEKKKNSNLCKLSSFWGVGFRIANMLLHKKTFHSSLFLYIYPSFATVPLPISFMVSEKRSQSCVITRLCVLFPPFLLIRLQATGGGSWGTSVGRRGTTSSNWRSETKTSSGRLYAQGA